MLPDLYAFEHLVLHTYVRNLMTFAMWPYFIAQAQETGDRQVPPVGPASDE